MSETGKTLYRMLDFPDDWEIGEFIARHIPSDTRWWVASGVWFFDGDENTGKCLGIFERHVIYSKYKRMVDIKIASRLTQSKEVSK